MIRLEKVDVPSIGVEAVMPTIGAAEYEARLAGAAEAMARRGLDFLVVYGDREHFANLAFLSGFDPRFEEAVLLLDARGRRVLLVGNECLGYVDPDGPRLPVQLFQDFSLLGQPRGDSPPLRDVFGGFGIGPGAKVGCVGWKHFPPGSGVAGGPRAIEIPSYLVDLLRELAGDAASVTNATEVLMDSAEGLRIVNSAAQIARFEYAAIRTSESVRAVIAHLTEGVSERELAAHLADGGLPHSCHAMISVGAKVKRGLSSPSDNVARLGDPFVVAFGLWGALTCRAGAVAAGPEDLPSETCEFFGRLAANYFDVVACWYEHVRVGAVGGEVFEAVDGRRDPDLFEFAVNPGHSIHLDEWANSQFFRGSRIERRSGMALQMDIIPVSAGPLAYVNAEDGVALADEALRRALAEEFPDCWRRIAARRDFMRDALGIDLDESVLPLSNTPAVLAPYLLRPDRVFVQA